jgi:hypothetical protein
MSRIVLAATIFMSLASASIAFAQSTTTSNYNADTAMNPMIHTALPGMAATTSDPGNKGTGASSSRIGTGAGSGVMSPWVPGTGGTGATGANPNSTRGYNP